MREILIDLADYNLQEIYTDSMIRCGENKASKLVITLSEEYVGYDYKLVFQLNNNESYETFEIIPSNDILEYELTNVVTFESGTLKVELQAYDTVSGELIKTVIFPLKVGISISGVPEILPPEYESYLELKDMIDNYMDKRIYDVANIEDVTFMHIRGNRRI